MNTFSSIQQYLARFLTDSLRKNLILRHRYPYLQLTTGSVGWTMFSNRLQISLGKIWSWLPVFPGRMPRNAKKTASGDPIQKKFSTYNDKVTLNLKNMNLSSVIDKAYLRDNACLLLDHRNKVNHTIFLVSQCI